MAGRMRDWEMVHMYQPPTTQRCTLNDDGRCEDLFPLFIYCVIIPGILVLLLLFVLVLIMCCSWKSCKCKKYSSLETQNDAIQMDSYNTIRRASANLRHMSHNRDTPMMGSRSGSMTLDRSYRRTRRGRDSCHSAPGTLQRQNRHRARSPSSQNEAPPPPAYSIHSDDVFLGQDFLPPTTDMQSSVRYEDSPDNVESGAQPLLYHHHYTNYY